MVLYVQLPSSAKHSQVGPRIYIIQMMACFSKLLYSERWVVVSGMRLLGIHFSGTVLVLLRRPPVSTTEVDSLMMFNPGQD